jgi:hypothetical protein
MRQNLMTNVDHDINDGDSRAYIDADAVTAMLARMYLYSNQLDDAIQYSTLLFDARPLADISNSLIYGRMLRLVKCCGLAVFEAGPGHRDQMFLSCCAGAGRQKPSTNQSNIGSSYDPAIRCVILPISRIFRADWFIKIPCKKRSAEQTRTAW